MITSPLCAQTLTLTGTEEESGAPGTTISIYGNGFDATAANNSVTFFQAGGGSSTAATVTSLSGNVLRATVPNVTGGNYRIRVRRSSDNATATTTDIFSVVTGGTVLFDANAGLTSVRFSSSDWGDYDGDGDLDFVVTGRESNGTYAATIYENTNGSFTAAVASMTGVRDGSSEWGDFDGDGDLDLVIMGRDANLDNTTTIYENTSSGFTAVSAGLVDLVSGSSSWGDYDGDGDLDLLLTGEDAGQNPRTILYNNNSGNFSSVDAGLIDFKHGSSDWGDYDGDGDLDLVACGMKADNIRVPRIYENTGGGSLSELSVMLGSISGTCEWGDLDGDGDLDLLLTGYDASDSPGARIYEYTSSGFTYYMSLNGVASSSSDWGDYDGDGDLDLVVTGRETGVTNTTTIYENTGSGFSVVGARLSGVKYGSSEWGDYDGDGDLDLLITGQDNSNNEIAIIYGNENNILPTTRDGDLFGVQAANVIIMTESFPFSDGNASDELEAVEITALPASGNTLFLDGDNDGAVDFNEAIPAGSQIERSYLDAGQLKMKPSTTLHGFRAVSFDFKVSDGWEYSAGLATMNITLDARVLEVTDTDSSGDGWRFIANPFDSNTGDLLNSIWTQGITGASITAGSPNVFSYNESNRQYEPLADLNTPTGAARGLAVYIYEDDDGTTSGIQGGWPKTLVTGGTPNTGTVNITVSNTDADNSGTLTGDEGWNLLGNPYGTAINVDSLLADLDSALTDVNMNIAIWDPNANSGNGAYVTKSLGNNETIAPYQAFFVRAMTPDESVNVSFNDNIRTDNKATFLKESFNERPHITLNIKGQGLEHFFEIGFQEHAREGIDIYDSFRVKSLANDYVALYQVIGDQGIARSMLSPDQREPVRLPLHVRATRSGSYILETAIESLPPGWSVELEDLQTGELVDLFNGETIEVELSAAQPKPFTAKSMSSTSRNDNPRFALSVIHGTDYTNEVLVDNRPQEFILEQNYPNPFNPSTTIRYGLPERSEVTLKVYNLVGRKILTLVNGTRAAGTYRITFNPSTRLSNGVYLYRLNAGGRKITRKMILIK